MIPVLFLVGLIAGAYVHHARRRARLAWVLVSLAWGVMVGLDAGSLRTSVAGTALAALNLLAGRLVGSVLRAPASGRAARSRIATAPRSTLLG